MLRKLVVILQILGVIALFAAAIFTLVLISNISVARADEYYLDTSGYVEMDEELIEELQRALNDKLDFIKSHSSDYYVNIKKLKPLTVDGKFGPQTLTRLKLFQYAAGLKVDGICGPATWKKLGKNYTDCIYYAPDLFEAFSASSSGYGFILALDTNRHYVFETKEDGWLLIAKWKAATGNQKKGYITPSGTFLLSNKKGKNHDYIWKKDVWKADDATGFYHEEALGYFYLHATLDHWKNGEWVADDPDDVLGKSVSHGCVRLAPENAKWVSKHRNGTVLVIVDRDPLYLE